MRDTSLLQARPRVLFVYDPDCDHCMEVIAQERQSPNLKGRVWAVCVTDAGQATQRRRVVLPASWQSVTHDTSSSQRLLAGGGTVAGGVLFPISQDRNRVMAHFLLEKYKNKKWRI